jgi:hypothetical protein
LEEACGGSDVVIWSLLAWSRILIDYSDRLLPAWSREPSEAYKYMIIAKKYDSHEVGISRLL